MSNTDQAKDKEECKACKQRRDFIKAGVGSLLLAGGGAAVFGYEFLSPNVLYEPSPIVNAGKVERYAKGTVTPDPANGLYIVHSDEGIYAMSAVCTHLGCLTTWKADSNSIACPCHGSKFRTDGTKIEGPAPQPLAWLKTSISDDGELLIDRSMPVPTKEFLRV
jgi:cytochrome b6-f complex iron-sulfur subunit